MAGQKSLKLSGRNLGVRFVVLFIMTATLGHETPRVEILAFFLFLSWVLNTQLKHWIGRVVRTRLIM